jgi:uncharacterized protein YceK
MMKILLAISILALIIGCGSVSDRVTVNKDGYIIHKNITTTLFWIGEESHSDNQYIPNLASAWDGMWMTNYGGVDTPNSRSLNHPTSFTPNENPFYFALPYNDFNHDSTKKEDILSLIPWASKNGNPLKSICKNRWIKIRKNNKVAYAQWEDVGPFGEDDKDYVFGTKQPKSAINNHAGLDVSPAVKDYLNLKDIDTVSWEFVNSDDVPNGEWKKIITTRNVNW